MKVLHLVKTTSGAIWALRQIKVLIDLGCEVWVALPNDTGTASAYRAAGANVVILVSDVTSLKNPLSLFRSIYAFRRLVKEIRPDVIHSHFVGTTLFMRIALFRMSVARCFQVPGPLHLESCLTRAVEIALSNDHDYWIATCNRTRKYYIDAKVSASKLFLTYYGTDTGLFSPSAKGVLRRELGVPDGVKIVGMVAYAYGPKKWLGQSRGIKGHEDLIDAMSLVLQHRSDVVCVFVGGAWVGAEKYYGAVKKYGKKILKDKAIFLGSRSDVASLYPDFDLVVHPSHSENLGGAAESLLMGVPTLTTSVGGFPDIIIPGETGWMVSPRDPAMLSNAILEILCNPDEAIKRAHAGRVFTQNILDIRETGRAVYGFYQDILNRKG
ncbi:glycosyltransferase family 4 protein [Pseudomonas sp. MTM4]|uniref:glycosyltransferase n=1 Tax=unclassified Pseudomonas TaxID=196821 RepID=UPI0018D255FA|nr:MULTISPECIES: glycosyltransferase [unclassified Pseudomonas]MBC8651633.1 glycosyltransferase family 4 protein [Pseudomonas sp. MT4]QXY91341.1 glycosyltransferase family 4 protein [Pseudomonas sp. MTM4]